MVKLEKNTLHTVKIEDYSADGMGIARIEGMVVFVKNAVCGEVCRIKLVKVLKNMCYGIIDSIIEPSAERIEPDCPEYRLCGGCDFRHLSYAEECRLKMKRVEDTLRRVGGIETPPESFNPSEKTENYRNKAQYFFSDHKAGFYRSGSHDVVFCPMCRIQDSRSDLCRDAVKNWMEECSVPAYNEKTGQGVVRCLQVRCGTGGALVTLVCAKERLNGENILVEKLRSACPDICGVVLNINKKQGNVILGDRDKVLWGNDFVTDRMCGREFAISSHSFYQINRPQAEKLYAKAAEYLSLEPGETLMDLYCGIGTIGISVIGNDNRLIGVEIVPQAVENAKENTAANGIENAEFICGDAGEAAKLLASRGEHPDAIVVDPPRKGLSADVIKAIEMMQPKRVVYISCDPATLARDLKLFSETTAYRPTKCEAFDMFPGCAHVETVVFLSRKS